jgi:hypothetical protein
MVAAVNYEIGGPTSGHPGGTWSIQNTNNSTVGRYRDLAFLSEGSLGATNFTTSRPGVFPGPADSGASVPVTMACAPTGSGLNIAIRPGAAAVERTVLGGTYPVVMPSSATVTLGTADAVNSRIDRVDLQVFDGALGDNGGVSLTRYLVTTGTASGTPAIPAAPTNSVALSRWLLPANTTLLTVGMLTDARKSTAVRGAVRVLLPGDSLTDVGFMPGELRDNRILKSAVPSIDSWDVVNSVWQPVAPTNGTSDQLLAIQQRSTSTSTSAGGELQVLTSGALSLDALTAYRVIFYVHYSGATAGDTYALRIRDTNTSGTQREIGVVPAAGTATSTTGTVSFIYSTTSAETHTFVGTIARAVGSGSATVTAPTYITVERICPSGFVASV